MSTITTTRSYNAGANFSFSVAARNGYGIDVSQIQSMQAYLEPDSETIDSIGDEYAGSLNTGLYPGVRISGQLINVSVIYDIQSAVSGLTYRIKFMGGTNPIPPYASITLSSPQDNERDWSPEPLVLPVPTIDTSVPGAPDPSTLQFVVWHCHTDGNDYPAGSHIYVSTDLFFEAQWQPAPVTVAIETDSDENDTPEFENE